MRLVSQRERHRFCVYSGCDMPEGKVLSRLGDILYWLACIVAALIVVWGALSCFRADRADDPYLCALMAVAAFAIWAGGRACRYIFSGK
jgi:hypothetical protein